MRNHQILGTLGLLIFALSLAGCEKDSPTAPQQLQLGNDMVQSIELATRSGNFTTPLDATPDLEGNVIYFTATGPQGQGVFRVPASGGEGVEIKTGAPFVAPRGLAMATNGQQIYVTDPQAANGVKVGQIFVQPSGFPPLSGGAPTPLRGTEGTGARGLEVVKENGADMIYFTGNDPSDGRPAVFKISASGSSAPTIVAKDPQFILPDGVTVTKSGVVYVTDQGSAGAKQGCVFRVEGARITKIANNIHMGDPAGVALTADDAVLMVSALDRTQGTSQVLLIDLASLQTGLVTKVIEANKASGGLHRAYNNPKVFAWIDVKRGVGKSSAASSPTDGNGVIFLIKLK
jgi:DNA-binding beta-propeller fold protein YncE